jgi:hypothetical protein
MKETKKLKGISLISFISVVVKMMLHRAYDGYYNGFEDLDGQVGSPAGKNPVNPHIRCYIQSMAVQYVVDYYTFPYISLDSAAASKSSQSPAQAAKMRSTTMATSARASRRS